MMTFISDDEGTDKGFDISIHAQKESTPDQCLYEICDLANLLPEEATHLKAQIFHMTLEFGDISRSLKLNEEIFFNRSLSFNESQFQNISNNYNNQSLTRFREHFLNFFEYINDTLTEIQEDYETLLVYFNSTNINSLMHCPVKVFEAMKNKIIGLRYSISNITYSIKNQYVGSAVAPYPLLALSFPVEFAGGPLVWVANTSMQLRNQIDIVVNIGETLKQLPDWPQLPPTCSQVHLPVCLFQINETMNNLEEDLITLIGVIESMDENQASNITEEDLMAVNKTIQILTNYLDKMNETTETKPLSLIKCPVSELSDISQNISEFISFFNNSSNFGNLGRNIKSVIKPNTRIAPLLIVLRLIPLLYRARKAVPYIKKVWKYFKDKKPWEKIKNYEKFCITLAFGNCVGKSDFIACWWKEFKRCHLIRPDPEGCNDEQITSATVPFGKTFIKECIKWKCQHDGKFIDSGFDKETCCRCKLEIIKNGDKCCETCDKYCSKCVYGDKSRTKI
ncbi:unnamed protein product [Meganyctiphanes norvegica]|uniref:Uncharacterized protein n=1 Tax=Meganyctiphanes norvegica TaxID=48144 RepID=A0AAV2PLL2_MEGNR